MTHSAEAVARQLAENAIQAAFRDHTDHPARRGIEYATMDVGKLRKAIVWTLTAFASQQVRQTWEEATKIVKQSWTFDESQQHTHTWHDMADTLEKFRRRAQEEKK